MLLDGGIGLRQNQPLFSFSARSLILHQRKCPNSVLSLLVPIQCAKVGKASIDRTHHAVAGMPNSCIILDSDNSAI